MEYKAVVVRFESVRDLCRQRPVFHLSHACLIMAILQRFIYLVFLYSNVSCFNWLAVDYYEKLITESTQAALTYEIPKNNADFLGGFQSTEIKDAGNYDFIIVGSGSAGSVIATRLSEIDDWNILLLEAGGEENDFNRIPSMWFHLPSTNMSWGYYSTPQKHCCFGMKGNRLRLPKGKLVGGSSSINAMQYTRGTVRDYDTWEAMGNPGWSYADVLPYFIKSENSEIDGDPGYHGKGGLLNIEYGYAGPISSIFGEANGILNRPNLDYNGRSQVGYSRAQSTIKAGRRHSTATAFLERARKRKNLKVITRALATKIVFDGIRKSAEGVIFVTNKGKFIARAGKEVILSAGSVGSPQLLMLSGIGPRDHLNQLNIPVIADLPVGKHLQDHPHFLLYFHTDQKMEDKDLRPKIESYLKATGPLTAPAKIESVSFIDVGNSATLAATLITPSGDPITSTFQKIYNFNEEILDNYLKQVNITNDFLVFLILLNEKSKGVITLKSSNPLDFPNIDMNYFSEFEDVENMIKGIKFIMKMSQTEPFRRIGTTPVDFGMLCSNILKYSDQYWECLIRHIASTTHHLSGTTMMGNNPLTSVVNANLEVHEIGKLRIVDAGIFPTSLTSHTNGPSIMVAEKASDKVKLKYNRLECRPKVPSPTCHTNLPSDIHWNFWTQ